ncbi:C40 family peptidase [Bacillus sp. H-16]|uniref:C40 family peptidase n=1 Tax=Alteribacter salitolerans TaxID=2912333 RepID=UPI0019659CA2|nr:NlpC/P60 family protein [Alteribacter salitolerans]MBM7096257.1 C40 family peptidase [Alteribacter salitolerans]
MSKNVIIFLIILTTGFLLHLYSEFSVVRTTDSFDNATQSVSVSLPELTGLEETTVSFDQLGKDLGGTPYNGRGKSPEQGFSTATLTQYMYEQIEGVLLSRHARLQQELGKKVKKSVLKEGDLLFFKGNKSTLTGIYLSNHDFVTATKDGVAIRNLSQDAYWKKRFIEGRRLTDKEKKMLTPATHLKHSHPAITEAISLLHRPYRLTGDTLAAFDCSFLVQHAFEVMNIHLPRITYHQFEVGETIPLEKAKPGDVIYFSGTWQKGISHTGIYLGERFFIHASGEEGETTISYLGDSWMRHFTGVKRFDRLQVNRNHPIVDKAYGLLNVPYHRKGSSPEKGFNRSGFLHYLYHRYDRNFPRSLKKQWQYGETVKHGDEQPGDVFFFRSDNNNPLPAIYIGNTQLIVVREDDGVSIVDPRFSHYWTKERLMGIKRYELEEE